jgi:hypothetical protein
MQGDEGMMQKKANQPIGVLEVLGQWLSARAALVLVLLMVQIGLVLALFTLYRASSGNSSASSSRGGGGVACGGYEVLFAPGVQVGELRQWALNFDAQIVAGPNARGAFEVQVPQLTLEQLRQALGTQAADLRVNPLCPAQGED